MTEHVMSEDDVARRLAGGSGRPRRHNLMDRFINGIELIAAFFVGIVAADIFISVLLRYFFSIQIPDAYDFGRLLLGILIFWGIAATSYRGTHITVDLVWANSSPRWQRVIDIFATLVLLFVVTVQTYTLFDRSPAPIATMCLPLTCACRPGRSLRSPGLATFPPCCSSRSAPGG
jgi:hypothetical protein